MCGDELFKITLCQGFAHSTLIKVLSDYDTCFCKSHLHLDLLKFLLGFLMGCLVFLAPFDTYDWNLEIYDSSLSLSVNVITFEMCAAYYLAIFSLVSWYDNRHL